MAPSDIEFEGILDDLFEQVLILDRHFRIERANRACLEALGIAEPHEIVGKRCYQLFQGANHPCDDPDHPCPVVLAIDQGKPVTVEQMHRCPVERSFHARVKAIPLRGEGGEVSRVAQILLDITPRKKVEDKLLEATRKFRMIGEMGEDAILVLSDDFLVEFANSMASDLTGYWLQAIMGRDFLSLLDEKDRELFLDLARKSPAEEDRRFCTQLKLTTAVGNRRSCEVCISEAHFSEGGRKVYVYIRDLSERLRMENKLREANEFLINIIDSSTDGIIAADMKGKVFIFNEGAERLLGYKAEEVVGKFSVANFYPPGMAQDIMRKLRSNKHGGKGRLLPHRIMGITEEGEHIPISLSGSLIYQDGRESASVGIFSDLRKILEAQEELLESEAKFRELFETVRHGLYFSTREGKFLECNQAMVEMLGYPHKEEVLALDLVRDLYLNPSDRMEFQRMIEAEGSVKDYEVQFKRKDGEPITVLLTAHVRKDLSGRILGYQGLFVNITERLRLEDQLFQSEKLAAMGRLTAQIAHELNNPIYGVMNCLDLLTSEVPEGNKKRKFLDMALSETERMSGLLKSMLNFFRPDEDVKTHVNLNKLIEEVLVFIGKQLREFKIKVVLDLAEDLPLNYASGNQMKQVLLNMIMNSKAAMPQGGGTLTIATLKDDDKVLLRISDTGVGIPPEVRGRIFEAFFTTKSDVKGVGLGLSVCFGIIRQHEGSIEVESELGAGTTFTITLPIAAS